MLVSPPLGAGKPRVAGSNLLTCTHTRRTRTHEPAWVAKPMQIPICIQQTWPSAPTLTTANTANIPTTHHCHQTSHHDVHAPTMDIPNAAIRNHMSIPDVASYLHDLKLLLYTSYF